MKKFFWLFFILAGLVEGTLTAKIFYRSSKKISSNLVITQKKQNFPQKIYIPKLSLEAQIEPVGIDQEGKMEIPNNSEIVAWYKFGPKLGEKGSIVLAGHWDSQTGPAIFYHLSRLVEGDKIIITDQNNQKFTFMVVKKGVYEENNFPVSEVFNQQDKERLNLITCRGQFNPNTQRYNQRIVIYSVRDKN